MIANVLTIAGTDPTGGAGIQADLKTFSALGAYGMSVITAVVAQNTHGVRRFVPLAPSFVAEQIEAVFDDVRVDAVKIGMVANAGIVEVIARCLQARADCPVVLDPVMVAKSGDRLVDPEAVAAIRERLIPLSTLITPNLPEAGVLMQGEEPRSLQAMRVAVTEMGQLGADWVLLKGGHLEGLRSVDLLASKGHTLELDAPRIATRNSHGTGCTLSAAITALLPGSTMTLAVSGAKEYLTAALGAADQLQVGGGYGPVHHFHALWK
ncbi:bifunctional hydroxymethylpyrimidine kinase/phosphomethylpyrimidine kinase [Pseudomonas vanderleydeniana]|uniref:hydroxymethylpyrimidine kinase n=1 Tax=Pseudomonas vanderleydeniana TaxID=2745495 RepID=A0A9E6PH76_9PSED|nr:bifunctional hydroxymethylpyrimidine kinase/phosphomethylpyrimidine kinase [Pseudomonas vanderleydeniana]QXI26394.1 bifunctional hydroxymethylpyrimidine kinase/phosphomethylpyrimidine kinase [Pseudomonas vanderleydeniana]